LFGKVNLPSSCRRHWALEKRKMKMHNRVKFVSNHFNDVKTNRAFRVDPVVRFSGKTFAGIGAPRSKTFISTGVPGSDRAVFNAPRVRMAPGMISPPWGTPGTTTRAPWGSPGAVSPAPRGGEKVAPPPRSRTAVTPPHSGEGEVSPQPHGETTSGQQPHGGGAISPPPQGSGGFGRGR
jgi:hypothetical protein